ncbi:MAG: hypothetical protein WC511_01670 [Candidatus Pacearchaeota archaeon]
MAEEAKIPKEFSPNDKPAALTYLSKKSGELIQAINLDLLQKVKTAILVGCQEKNDLEEMQIPSNPSCEDVGGLLSKIHIYAQKLQLQKEEVTHFISFFNSAKGYISSFKNSSEIIIRECLDTRKEIKNEKEALFNDLEIIESFLKNCMKDMNHVLDDVLSGRMNLCLRLESSLRLLEKYRPLDEKLAGFNAKFV